MVFTPADRETLMQGIKWYFRDSDAIQQPTGYNDTDDGRFYTWDGFYDQASAPKINDWNVSNVESFEGIFSPSYYAQDQQGQGRTDFDENLSNWRNQLFNATSLYRMFYGCTSYTGSGISNWDVDHVSDFTGMFNGASSFNADISQWNVSSATTLAEMFKGATAFNQDISNWYTAYVTTMESMFYGASSFNADISQWNVANVTTMKSMFYGCTAFNLGQPSGTVVSWPWNTSEVTTMANMFRGCGAFNQNISVWKTSKVTNMGYMFWGCTDFNQDVSSWDVSHVTTMIEMFKGCHAFNQDVSGWDVSSVTNMLEMFWRCYVFNQDVSGWDVSSVTDMTSMFAYASSFNQNIRGWVVQPATILTSMFSNAHAMIASYGTVTSPSYTPEFGTSTNQYTPSVAFFNYVPLRPHPFRCNTRYPRSCTPAWTTEKKAQFFSGTQNQMGFAVTDWAIMSRLVQTARFQQGSRTAFANERLNAFGRWPGAPGGSGSAPRNTFN